MTEPSSVSCVGSRARHTAERKSFALYPIKRLRSHKGIKFNDTSPASVSSKGKTYTVTQLHFVLDI
jgi:hypothetical protein